MSEIASHIRSIADQLPAHVTLIAVSKKQDTTKIKEAYSAGHKSFGENYVQELYAKAKALPSDIEWHFIGHLQSNKVKQVVEVAQWIQSVDSLKLLNEINKQAGKTEKVVNCLLQMHIAKEESKFGFDTAEVEDMLKELTPANWPFVKIRGVMGMSSLTDDQAVIRREFAELKNIFTHLKQTCFRDVKDFDQISMGMSGDWELAIKEGSTMVRIGSAIFGART